MGIHPDQQPNSSDEQECLRQEYLTVQEFADMLRVSPKSISRWVKNDPTLPVLRIGGVLRFATKRVLGWLKAREQGPGRDKRLPEPLPSHRERLELQGNGNAVLAPWAHS